MHIESGFASKLRTNLKWLVRYPFERTANLLSSNLFERKHVIITVANHFEPSWSPTGLLDVDSQKRRMEQWMTAARATGEALRDTDGTKFRHTNFFPGEQYDASIVDMLAELQTEGLGETEIHLHHGIGQPDTSESLRKQLVDFRDALAEEHRLLSRTDGDSLPRYAFVHGNLALANSFNGRFCGVDDEMRILQETGCYADLTLPSAPTEGQVPVFNKIYECALPLDGPAPHRKGRRLRAGGGEPILPMMITGPLVFNWTRRVKGIPVPRLEDGALTLNQSLDLARFNRWMNANICVDGRSDWVFVKLYCHGFFDGDLDVCIGDGARRFFESVIEEGEKTGSFKVHFASARETANMVWAAVDGKSGDPHPYRDYRLRTIMSQQSEGESRAAVAR
jgi:hypothetical protein